MSYSRPVPRKIRELLKDLQRAGFQRIAGGKGSHRKCGAEGADAKTYQEKQIRKAIEQVES